MKPVRGRRGRHSLRCDCFRGKNRGLTSAARLREVAYSTGTSFGGRTLQPTTRPCLASNSEKS